jgi:hypothetical protein
VAGGTAIVEATPATGIEGVLAGVTAAAGFAVAVGLVFLPVGSKPGTPRYPFAILTRYSKVFEYCV